MRVIVASERSNMRYLLRHAVEEEPGAVVVGQAENTLKALILAKNTRPDVAIIDFNLPHGIGLDAMPLSRINGLDTAQTIFEKIPNIRVVLVTNLDLPMVPQYDLSRGIVPSFSRVKTGVNTPFKLQELCQEVASPNDLVFANVEVKPLLAPVPTGSSVTEKAIFWGVVGILVGGYLTATLILAPIGIPIALASAITTFVGLVGKLSRMLRRKTSS